MKKEDKRGLSTVIATLLIIVLVIAAVGIVWVIVATLITDSTGQISFEKFTIDLEIVSVNQTSENVNIKVRRNPGAGNLEGILFSIFDGNNSHTYEKRNITLNELEMKTFVINYQGKIVSISIYPFIKAASGKITLGGLADTFYMIYKGGEYIPSGGGSTPGETPDCSCAATICVGTFCNDGIGGSCEGTLQPDCNNDQIMCGDSLNGCGSCGECEDESYCSGGVCSPICNEEDCGTRVCGALPDRSDCGETFCGVCNVTLGEWCINGVCTLDCTPDCGLNNCGPVPNGCGTNCGVCNETAGEWCENGRCTSETFLNSGIIYSIWPINVGIYFDSSDLPKSPYTDYTNYWVKFPENLDEFDCLQIERFVTPVIPEIYNMSYIKLLTASSGMNAGDYYEVWMNYGGCTTN